jgi:hypothetical protein
MRFLEQLELTVVFAMALFGPYCRGCDYVKLALTKGVLTLR